MTEAWMASLPDLLAMLKVDLGIMSLNYDKRLKQYLEIAFEQITIEGITLVDTSISDKQLVVLYAAWLWRRRDTGTEMPRMLRYALNNRLFSEKMREELDEDMGEDEEEEDTNEDEDGKSEGPEEPGSEG